MNWGIGGFDDATNSGRKRISHDRVEAPRDARARIRVCVTARFLLFILLATASPALGREGPEARTHPSRAELSPLPPLRSERLRLSSGAELVTIFGQAQGVDGGVPLVAVLNDTLGDDDVANDRLRYVWVFSYCPPSVWRRVLATIPFNYHRFSSGTPNPEQSEPPPAVFDLARSSQTPWRRILWYVAQSALLDPQGWLLQAGGRTYARNEREYRRLHLELGLSVLSQYSDAYDDVPELDDPMFGEVYGRVVGGGFAGLFLSAAKKEELFNRETKAARERVGKNWELLRQRCEQEGLWFEPLPGPPARARHAIVWVSQESVARSERDRRFDGRFLSVSSPWSDVDLRSWTGYTKQAYVDQDGRIRSEPVAGARPVAMIPLAMYGLDFPKIPALLVDFRSVFNSKRRELSGRVLDDVGKYLLDISAFGDLKYYVGKKLFEIVTRRKGVDISQPSRVHSYAQLRALLVLESELDPELQAIVRRDLERLNFNPLGTDLDAERDLAFAQQGALVAYAESGALDEKLEEDRAGEMAKLAHGRVAKIFLRTAEFASLGLYKHRDDTPELRNAYATERALERRAVLLAEVASAPAPIEVTWAPERFRDALEYVAAHGRGDPLARTCEAIFRKSEDLSTRLLALDALHRIGGTVAITAIARAALDPSVSPDLRRHCDYLLGNPVAEVAGGESREAKAVR
jgi:hypothetical protein